MWPLKIGEDLKQCAASFTETKSNHMTPGGSLEEKVEPRLGRSWRLPQEEAGEEEHDNGILEASVLKCTKEVGLQDGLRSPPTAGEKRRDDGMRSQSSTL